MRNSKYLSFILDITNNDVSNPVRFTKLIKETIGLVASAKYVDSDKVTKLMFFCKSREQQEKVTKLGKEVV